jgi:hypothetical protein
MGAVKALHRIFSPTAGACFLLFLAFDAAGQAATNFTGQWRQDPASAVQRQLQIEQNGKNLLVKMANVNSQGTRQLEVKYEIGGPETTYVGLDGDQFRSTVRWDGQALVFDTIEHEDGKDIPQKTVWTLSPDGNTLQIDKETAKSGKPTHSLTTYVRRSEPAAKPAPHP